MAALSPWMWVVGYALLVAVAVVWPNPIVLLILLLGGLETVRRWRARREPESQAYYRVRPAMRAAIGLTYVGLAALLVLGMHGTHVVRHFSDV
jgi:hypothetical protein